ncbi:MAG: 3'-5' exonuclease [Pirellulaceae bacterium]
MITTGISSLRIADTPVAVIDFETTGLVPGHDRVVEVSVVRIDPGKPPEVVFDTLINPLRPMGATEIHGITDADVINAPRFQDIAGELLAATQDCVISAYNVYFDIKFLNFELANAGVTHAPPHFCLMYLRPMLGLGSRCKLDVACRAHNVNYEATHIAADDAFAAGLLFGNYLQEINRQGVSTYGDLARLRKYKFNESFSCQPFPDPGTLGLKRFEKAVSRAGFAPQVDPVRQAIASYWDTLKTVLADLEITEEELQIVLEERKGGGLKKEQIRMLHAKAFSGVISQFTSDQWLDDGEVIKLRKLHDCLSKLGWAPGQ